MHVPSAPPPAYPHLFAPWRSGRVSIANRIVMGAMHTVLERLDRPAERIAAFYRERADGGVGLIITGGVSPNPQGRFDTNGLWLAPGRDEAWHRAIVGSVHGTDTKMCMQLLHTGRYAKIPECVGPSARQATINRYAPAALSTEAVWRTIDDYARAAELAHDLGYHGVEIMASEGYLINQFTARLTNDRNDEFGGSLENRSRFSCEIVKAIRRKVPADFLVIYRISAVDLISDGMTGEETRQLAALVEQAGASMLNTGIGWHESRVPTVAAVVPRAGWSYAIRQVKESVAIPVIASNRINDPSVAEALLAEGVADFVSLARPLLADARFATKAKSGQADAIATCIACNQACIDRAIRDVPISCMVNPRAGHELELPVIPATKQKRIAVVGGGVAGMAFAFNAAERGHHITLYEAGSRLGGQILMAQEVPEKFEFKEALRYFRHRLAEAAVTVHLDRACSVDELEAGDFDEFVIATGVFPRKLDLPGIEDSRVLSYAEVLRDSKPVGRNVAIIGAGGIGFDVAEFLLGAPGKLPNPTDFADEYGLDLRLETAGGLMPPSVHHASARRITLMQRKPGGPRGIAQAVTTSWIHRGILQRGGVEMLGGVEYRRIEPAGLVIAVDGQERVIPTDTIVICVGQESERSLYDELITRLPASRVHLIGGAAAAGELDAVRAIDEATRLALSI